MDEPDYSKAPGRNHLAQETQRLLTLAALPLIDGFFLVFLTTGLWEEPWQAVVFGLTAFSGAGCFAAATQLTGTLKYRVKQVVMVYSLVVIGALFVSLTQPIFESLLPSNVHLFTAVFLIGLGLYLSGVRVMRKVAKFLGFEAAVKVMIAASLIQGLFHGVDLRLSLDITRLPAISITVFAGFLLTLAGMVFGLVTRHTSDQRPLNLGAGTSLVLMGLNLLGMGLSPGLVIAPLAAGSMWLVGGILLKARRLPSPAVLRPRWEETLQ